MTTHRLIPSILVSVPQSQVAEYARIIGRNQVIPHPASVKGLTPKLNWLLDPLKTTRKRADAFFVDDDIQSVQRCFVEKGETATVRDHVLIETIIRKTARLARDVGAYYFGWEAGNGSLRNYIGLKPFMFTGYINGCAMGFRRGHGLRFDERIVAKNDFDIATMNAWRHRICLKDCHYTFCQRETFTGHGGQAAYRTSAT